MYISVKNEQYRLIISYIASIRVVYIDNSLIQSVDSITGFNFVTDVMKSKRGYPRIYFDGHQYGLKNVNSNTTVWLCTGSMNKKRCTASIHSRQINGIEMMKIQNGKHLCESTDELTEWMWIFVIFQLFIAKNKIE